MSSPAARKARNQLLASAALGFVTVAIAAAYVAQHYREDPWSMADMFVMNVLAPFAIAPSFFSAMWLYFSYESYCASHDRAPCGICSAKRDVEREEAEARRRAADAADRKRALDELAAERRSVASAPGAPPK